MLHSFSLKININILLLLAFIFSASLVSSVDAADYVVTGTDAVTITPGTDATATEAGNLLVDGDTLVTGGVGGWAFDPAPGGNGGHATMTVGGDLTSHAVTVTGGAAGDNGTTTPEGGDGGDAALTVNGNLAASQDITLTAGHGSGGGLPNGYGGKGGSAALSVSGGLTTSQGLAITGGNGGRGGLAYGGAGGNSILSVGGGLTTNQSLDLTGGNGGEGNLAYGGAGGNSILSVYGGLTANQGLTLTGGNGGKGGTTPSFYGGVGGKVSFAGSAVSVGALNVTSGMDGANVVGSGGSGGAAEFTATSLSAPTINLIRQDSALNFNVGTLRVTQATALNLNETTATDVLVNGIVFANGSALTVTQVNSGAMTAAGNLSVTGAGNVYNSPIAWDATGKALSFDLTGLSDGDTMLSATGTGEINITGATVNISDVPSTFSLGGRATLLDGITAAYAGAVTNVTSPSNVNRTFLMGGTDSALTAFLSTVQTTGDYAIAGPYSVAAGAGLNESVLLDVGGKLSLTGDGLSLTDNGANSATLNAGTLVTPALSLTGANTRATIGTLDVSGMDSALNLSGTTAANVSIGAANLSGGRLLSIDNSAGAMTLNALNVTGQGRLYVANGGRQDIGALNAANADLTFVLPAGVVAGQTIVAVNSADISGATIGVSDTSGRIALDTGESVKLIAASSSLTGTMANLTVQTAQGDIFSLRVSGNELLLLLEQVSPTTPGYERLKAFAEGRSANLAFVNQGQDLILNQGFGSALASTAGSGWRFAGFGGMSGGWSRYNTGSHVDVSGASLLAGLVIGNDLPVGRMTAGIFVEGGWGDYNSRNSFSNYAPVEGDGDTSYFGGGILGRYDAPCGAYIDASARTGRASMDFSTDDIRYGDGTADFDSSSWYYGAHAGLGYQWSFSEKTMLDLSGKLLWTRQEGDSVNVGGDSLHFKETDSLRTRLGGRFNYEVNECVTPYAGAYWEHEFDGKARSTVNGVGIDAPTLKGDTGMGELGITLKPVADSGFSFDLGVQGYTGVREGVSGSAQLKFEF